MEYMKRRLSFYNCIASLFVDFNYRNVSNKHRYNKVIKIISILGVDVDHDYDFNCIKQNIITKRN